MAEGTYIYGMAVRALAKTLPRRGVGDNRYKKVNFLKEIFHPSHSHSFFTEPK
jgi:hypothetical protein